MFIGLGAYQRRAISSSWYRKPGRRNIHADIVGLLRNNFMTMAKSRRFLVSWAYVKLRFGVVHLGTHQRANRRPFLGANRKTHVQASSSPFDPSPTWQPEKTPCVTEPVIRPNYIGPDPLPNPVQST
jgi:hypothetical protein